MMVYRYLSADYGLQALQRKEWKVGRILELNDPLDCFPVIYNKKGDVEPSEHAAGILSRIHANWGVICYSARIDDPVVWSHYGDRHRGIALGFEFPDNVPIRPITYSDSRERVFLEGLHPAIYLRGLDDIGIVYRSFGTKATSWAYEEEWRQFIGFNGVGCRIAGMHYFQELPARFLRSVIIGPRSQVTIRDIVASMSAHREDYGGATFSRASFDLDNYRLKITPVELTSEAATPEYDLFSLIQQIEGNRV